MYIHKTILRIKKKSKFTVMSNYAIEDKLLTPAALGVLVYLLSKPDDWVVYNGEVQRRFGIGRKKFDRIMGELKQAGYIIRQTRRNRNGTFYTETIVCEVPLPLFGTAAYPADVPLPDSGSTVNGAAGNGKGLNNQRTEVPRTESPITNPSADSDSDIRSKGLTGRKNLPAKTAALEIYAQASQIEPEQVQPLILEWLHALEADLTFHPEALTEALKEADQSKPGSSPLEVDDIETLYREQLQWIDEPMYALAYDYDSGFSWQTPKSGSYYTGIPRLIDVFLEDGQDPDKYWVAEELSPEAMKLAEKCLKEYVEENIDELEAKLKQKRAEGTG